MSDRRDNYNLLEEAWIPVLWADGKFSRVGIREALAEAGRIRQLAASNPMDRVAVLRFLLALLYWCKGNPPDAAVAVPVRAFPPGWFTRLDENKELFDLLGSEPRFYQDAAAKRSRTSTDLLQEIPSGNNFWHFRHSTDGIDGLCPACCALGLLRLPMFSVSGTPNLLAGINGPPPVYAVRIGRSLLETLLANWTGKGPLGTPAWVKPNEAPASGKKVPLLTGMTMLSRRVWLHGSGEPGTCIACGHSGLVICNCESQTAGRQENELWDDPHVAYDDDTPGKAERAADLTAAGRFRMDRPWPYLLASIVGSGKFALPDRPSRVLVVGFATNKAKNIDVWERVFELPAGSRIPDTAKAALERWHSEGRRLEGRLSRAKCVGAAVSASVRPTLETEVSSRTVDLLTDSENAWESAAMGYRPMMQAVARSLSPGSTVEAVVRRRQIGWTIPDVRPQQAKEGKRARKGKA